MKQLITHLWFDTQAEEAAHFYAEVFKDVTIGDVTRYPAGAPGPEGQVMTIEFTLFGQSFVGLNGGPIFHFTEAVSFMVPCEDQAEVDRLWDALTADGGQESQCGWLKDKFGVSWQIIPTRLTELLQDAHPDRAQRAMQAMLKQHKIIIQELEDAANNQQ